MVQVVEEVIKLCYGYAMTAKDARRDISALASEVQLLQGVLEDLDELSRRTRTEGDHLSTLSRLAGLGSTLDRCSEVLAELTALLAPPTNHARIKTALGWPFKSKDTNKTIESIRSLRDTITLALATD